MHGSIATDIGRPYSAFPIRPTRLPAWPVFDDTPELPADGPSTGLGRRLASRSPRSIGLALVALAAVVYVLSNPPHSDFYNHFVWQADAWLHGRLAIPYPVSTGPFRNDYFQDVMPLPDMPGYGVIPFPALPAVVLLPAVALLGLATPASLITALLGAVDVWLAWRLVTRLAADRGVAVAATAFFAFGTVAWYAAAIGTTWFLAHVVAMGLTLLAITVAVDAEPASSGASPVGRSGLPAGSRPAFLAGLLLGLAALSRLTVVFGAPFLVLVGGGSWRTRAVAAALGVVIPLVVLAGYNLASTGQIFNPAYAEIARVEFHPNPALYHPTWGVEDVRYIPQNLPLALFNPPEIDLACGVALLDPNCGTIRPNPIGMGLLLTSPAYLLALPALRWILRNRLVAGATIAVVLIALADAAHFSQGWVQFGWRFSNDFAPFALIPITLVMARWGHNRIVVTLVALSILVNAWGVYWGVVLGW